MFLKRSGVNLDALLPWLVGSGTASLCKREQLTPLCFVIAGGHSGSFGGGLNGATGIIGSWILVLEVAVKCLQHLVVSQSLLGTGSLA